MRIMPSFKDGIISIASLKLKSKKKYKKQWVLCKIAVLGCTFKIIVLKVKSISSKGETMPGGDFFLTAFNLRNRL